jgi:hypothetical protein
MAKDSGPPLVNAHHAYTPFEFVTRYADGTG